MSGDTAPSAHDEVVSAIRSYAAALYEAVSGRPTFEGETVLFINMKALIDHVCNEPARLRNAKDIGMLGIWLCVDC